MPTALVGLRVILASANDKLIQLNGRRTGTIELGIPTIIAISGRSSVMPPL